MIFYILGSLLILINFKLLSFLQPEVKENLRKDKQESFFRPVLLQGHLGGSQTDFHYGRMS